MIDGLGSILFSLSLSAGLAVLLLPMAQVFSGGDRSARFVWLGLISALYIGGWTFSALAVDLPRIALTPTLIAVNALGVGLIGVAVFLSSVPAVIRSATKIAEKIVGGAGKATFALIFAMALLQFIVVVLRYVFGINIIAMQEGVTYFHGAIFLIASGYVLLVDGHVRVDILYGGVSDRRKALINLIGAYAFLFPFCLLTLWTAAPYVENAWAVREGSTEPSGIQGIYLLKTLIPIFGTLLTMAGFATASRAAATLMREPL